MEVEEQRETGRKNDSADCRDFQIQVALINEIRVMKYNIFVLKSMWFTLL